MTARPRETAEHRRLQDPERWQRWGTYLSDRAWGTVREDYSADGTAWDYFPHDHARSRAYRWNEDGLAGFCDRDQHLCLALALWNERDPILKERLFGLTNAEGNHGEDAKEYWFHLDNLPTHAYARMVYKYPQVAFPYADLVAINGRRGVDQPEYELYDALTETLRGQRYFDVFVEYAKAGPEDILCRIEAVNRGPNPAPLHLLPHLWYRNTWSWRAGVTRPMIELLGPGHARSSHPALDERHWYARSAEGENGELLFTENETNAERLFELAGAGERTKDAIHEAIVHARADRVSRSRGSKAAAHFRSVVPAGGRMVVQVRLTPSDESEPFQGFDAVMAERRRECDEFYDAVQPSGLSADERLVQRQAFAGLLWSKQFYHFDVWQWLEGDPAQPPPPPERRQGRNRDWNHLVNADVLLMPDAWEYPWYASWDLAFHTVVMAAIDPAFAKEQILLLTRPTYQHPYGSIPAYEWDFGAVNPPVIAWAAWEIYQQERARTGEGDAHFLQAVFAALVLNLGWWVNRKDQEGNGIFGGGFLGLDNIGIFDRDRPLPTGGRLEQSDATGWMAMFQLNLATIAAELALGDPAYLPYVHRFGQQFVAVANALRRTAAGGSGLWDAEERFYFDVIRAGDIQVPLKTFSMAGLVPLFATSAIPAEVVARLPVLEQAVEEVLGRRPHLREILRFWVEPGARGTRLLAAVDPDGMVHMLRRMLDEGQFLSPFGLRSLSREHLEHPYRFEVGGAQHEIRYLPGESDSRIFGGNSNWRGPIWFPLNFLLIQALESLGSYYGETLLLEYPTGSGRRLTLLAIAAELAGRLSSIFLRDDEGRRPVLGANDYFQRDPHWRDCIPFHEYFHGDTGAGLGASHQTGWTALVALLLERRGAVRETV
jgi:hypothetical protein